MKISFIGYGNMARAIAQHVIKNPYYEIAAAAPSLSIGVTQDGIQTHDDNLAVITQRNLIVLAVKPQQAVDVLKQIGPTLPTDSLLISVVAGLSLSRLAGYCRSSQAIVRSMPNLPLAVGKGATPLIANACVTAKQKKETEALFQCGGMIAWMEHEGDMDRMTALSGSGPAYLFYFLEAMIRAGTQLGLPEGVVKPFAMQTLTGALELAKNSDLELSELRKKVTSPGGTTASAIDVFQSQGFDAIIIEAIHAAYERAKQLGA